MIQYNRKRTGITITEALASIAVAAVGLFAVIAVIPFAARQTEAGLDLDVSVSVGKNAFHDFDVRGFGNIKNWRLANIGGTANVTPNGNYWRGKTVVIDPLFLTNNDPVANPQVSIFPYPNYSQDENNASRIPFPNAPPPLPLGVVIGQPQFGIDRINLAARGNPFNFAQSETIFRSINELLYDESADKLIPPNQQFKRDGTVDMKRSYSGKISWMAMLVPETGPGSPLAANPHNYRLYVIVFRGRQINFRPTRPKGEAVFAGVLQGDPTVNPRVSPNGGVVDLKLVPQTALPMGINNELIQDDYLQSGDWILLTDYGQLDNNGNTNSVGQNWRWYQIQRVEPSDQTNQARELVDYTPAENGVRVTLVGSDWTGRDVDLTTPNQWDVAAIAMSNVVAVYEKTIRIEYDSIWND